MHVFQQDSAPAHRARSTVKFLRHETPDFISPELWPPNSPDLNPVDYKIWDCLQERVYKKPIRDLVELIEAAPGGGLGCRGGARGHPDGGSMLPDGGSNAAKF